MCPLTLIALTITLVATGATSAQQPPTLKPIVFWTGSDSHQMTKLFSRCDTREEMLAIWRKHQSRDESFKYRHCPEVDFEKCIVVAIFLGEGSGEDGLVMDDVFDEKDYLRLRFRKLQVSHSVFLTSVSTRMENRAMLKMEII